jgi:hypothetical protein
VGTGQLSEWAAPAHVVSRGTAYLSFSLYARNNLADPEEQERQARDKTAYVGYRFLDSFRFMAHSLDSLAKTFGCAEGKGDFPYVWLQHPAQLGRVYTVWDNRPDLTSDELQKLDVCDTNDLDRAPNRFDFPSGSGTHPVTGYPCMSWEEWADFCNDDEVALRGFVPLKALRKYLDKDLIILSEVWGTFRTQTLDRYDIDPNTCVSAPSLALRAFMARLKHRNLATLITRSLWNHLQEAKMGGHTEPLARFATCDPERAAAHNDVPMHMIMPWDANSLYPSMMATAWFPGGKPILYKCQVPEHTATMATVWEELQAPAAPRLIEPPPERREICAWVFAPPEGCYGFVCVDIEPPDDILYAPLGERIESEEDGYTRLEFNLLPKTQAVYFTEELKVAIVRYRYKVTRLHWYLAFQPTNDLFREFIEEVGQAYPVLQTVERAGVPHNVLAAFAPIEKDLNLVGGTINLILNLVGVRLHVEHRRCTGSGSRPRRVATW